LFASPVSNLITAATCIIPLAAAGIVVVKLPFAAPTFVFTYKI
jgi:hypothetical protein